MSISNVVLNVSDVGRSVELYCGLLGGVLVGVPSEDQALVDFTSATVELRRCDDATLRSPAPDEEVLGFRHVGFKVADVGALAARLEAAGVRFRMEPTDTHVGVIIAFFFDPDGTDLEIVAGELDYMEIHDPVGMAAERMLGVPDRPRLDHVALTVGDLDDALEQYAPLGFSRVGSLIPPDDAARFRIDYLRGGDTVLELFSYPEQPPPRTLWPDAVGFLAAEFDGVDEPVAGSSEIGAIAGRPLYVDANQLQHTVAQDSPC